MPQRADGIGEAPFFIASNSMTRSSSEAQHIKKWIAAGSCMNIGVTLFYVRHFHRILSSKPTVLSSHCTFLCNLKRGTHLPTWFSSKNQDALYMQNKVLQGDIVLLDIKFSFYILEGQRVRKRSRLIDSLHLPSYRSIDHGLIIQNPKKFCSI